ncbi:MAG: hypothetical protein HY752_01380 [Nitrospirae bacterium]|nr:hypothetical protein [Nitrospirota bacterium]
MRYFDRKRESGNSARMKISAPSADSIPIFWSKMALGAIMNKLSGFCIS